jgi:hypothetical protein
MRPLDVAKEREFDRTKCLAVDLILDAIRCFRGKQAEEAEKARVFLFSEDLDYWCQYLDCNITAERIRIALEQPVLPYETAGFRPEGA